MLTMRFEGGAELAKALDSLSVRVSKGIMREALTDGAEPIRKAARSFAPFRPGPPDIRENIGISSAKPPQQGDMAAVKIGPTKGFAYGLPQELGTRRHAAHPFMRPAFDTQHVAALGIIGRELWRQLAARGLTRSASMPSRVEGPDGGDLI